VSSFNSKGKEAFMTLSQMVEEKEKQKDSLLKTFSVGYLEEMLKSTTKSIARDVVSTLIGTEEPGVLLSLEKIKPNKQKSSDEEKKGPISA
jgi:hypothetical protein